MVGCSHIYSSDGQGMKYKLSKVQDFTLDGKKNPYLSENEAYRLGLNIKDLFHKSFSEMPKRVVIHKRTPFRKEEIKSLVLSLPKKPCPSHTPTNRRSFCSKSSVLTKNES